MDEEVGTPGLEHTSEGQTQGLENRGVGASNRQQVENVYYRAFTELMPASATFSIARAATIQAARDLYGVNSNVERAIADAWTAGVSSWAATASTT